MRAADAAYLDAPGPIGLAHRGGTTRPWDLKRENTFAAFEAAVAMGYRYLETDVHATSDGVLMAFHDSLLDRVTDRQGGVGALPYAVVREARIDDTEPIPRLEELLEAFPDVRFNIDVKSPGAIEPLVEVVERLGARDRVCIASFSALRLRAVRRRFGPSVATAATPPEIAALRLGPPGVQHLLRTPSVVLQIPTWSRLAGRPVELVTPQLVERVHAAGKHVHVWVVDDPAEMHRLFDLGVDGIVSDRIDVLAQVLAERGAPLVPPG